MSQAISSKSGERERERERESIYSTLEEEKEAMASK